MHSNSRMIQCTAQHSTTPSPSILPFPSLNLTINQQPIMSRKISPQRPNTPSISIVQHHQTNPRSTNPPPGMYILHRYLLFPSLGETHDLPISPAKTMRIRSVGQEKLRRPRRPSWLSGLSRLSRPGGLSKSVERVGVRRTYRVYLGESCGPGRRAGKEVMQTGKTRG